MVLRALENLDFSFSSWLTYCASNSGERVAVELISQHIRKILERNTRGVCQARRKLFFSLLFIINYRCVFEGLA